MKEILLISPLSGIIAGVAAFIFGLVSFHKNKPLFSYYLAFCALLVSWHYLHMGILPKNSSNSYNLAARFLAAHAVLLPFLGLMSGARYFGVNLPKFKWLMGATILILLLIFFTDTIIHPETILKRENSLGGGWLAWIIPGYFFVAIILGSLILGRRLKTSPDPLTKKHVFLILISFLVFVWAGLEQCGQILGLYPFALAEYEPLTGVYISSAILIFLFAHLYYKTKQLESKSVEALDAKEFQIKLANLEREAAVLSAQQIRSQLSSHFIFNSLNGVKQVVTQDVKKGREMINKISALLRWILSNNEGVPIPIGKEVQAIKNYLDIEKFRMDSYLLVEYDIDETLMEEKVPGFLIQPLVENAVKFGQQTSKSQLKITLAIAKQKSGIKITVSNSGSWVTPASDSPAGLGLTSLKNRLKSFYGSSYTLDTQIAPQRIIQELVLGV